MVPITPGDLIDRICILEIKSARLKDPSQLVAVRNELAAMRRLRDQALSQSPVLTMLVRELKSINEALWDIENDLRSLESKNDFGQPFVNVARARYHSDDRRRHVIARINQMFAQADTPHEYSAPAYDIANYGP